MLNNKQFILISYTLLAISQLSVGCSAEDIAVEDSSNKGILCLSLSSSNEFIKVETRAGQTLTDWSEYEFRLNDEPISFTDGKAVIPAGSYSLSATNSHDVDGGYDGALYSGETSFTLNAGEQKEVTLSLGAPKNAKVTINLSEDFKQSAEDDAYTYEISNFALGEKTLNLTSNTQDFFFPVPEGGELTYILTAAAKQGSHVQDITDAKGTVTIAPGTHTTLTLDVNPIDGYIRIEGGGEHSGVFE